MQIRLTPYGMDAWTRGLQQAPEMAQREMRKAMAEAVMKLEGDLKKRGHYPYRTGTTQKSIAGVQLFQPVGVLGMVGSPAPVAAFLEYGTRRMKARPSFPAALERHKHAIELMFEDAASRIAQQLAQPPGAQA